MTASRGQVTDTFDFSCSMELGAARVRNIEVDRRRPRDPVPSTRLLGFMLFYGHAEHTEASDGRR